jgi:hypothetical protein
MRHDTARRLGVTLRKKRHPIQLYAIKGTEIFNELIEYKTVPIKLRIDSHEEWACFQVTQTEKEDIVLGLPWMKRHDPDID